MAPTRWRWLSPRSRCRPPPWAARRGGRRRPRSAAVLGRAVRDHRVDADCPRSRRRDVRTVTVVATGSGPEALPGPLAIGHSRTWRRLGGRPSCWATPGMTRPRRSCWAWPGASVPAPWPGWPRAADSVAAGSGRCWDCPASSPSGRAGRTTWSRGETRTTWIRPSPASACGRPCCRSWRLSSDRASRRPWPGPRRSPGTTPTCSTPSRRTRTRARRLWTAGCSTACRRRSAGGCWALAPARARPRRPLGRAPFAVEALITDWHGQVGWIFPEAYAYAGVAGTLGLQPT